jgi:hypothetical protein
MLYLFDAMTIEQAELLRVIAHESADNRQVMIKTCLLVFLQSCLVELTRRTGIAIRAGEAVEAAGSPARS